MDCQKKILSKLVLGYLKSQRCKSAYREFLKTSSVLQHLDISQNKYIATRFLGLSLEDILADYSDVSQIIQGRLETTNYYNEHSPKETLSHQLLYLLNNFSSSRPTTPGYSTQGSNLDDKSPSHIDHCDLDATQIDALPGNSPNEKSFSPRRKGFNRYGKTVPATSSPIDKQNKSELFDTEVLAENLLENKEFHEKIAQTINKVVERQFDSTIKEVIQETEQDPIFDKILDEIIGTSNTMMEISKGPELHNTVTSINKRDKKSGYVEESSLNLQRPENNIEENIKSNQFSSIIPVKDSQQKSIQNIEGNTDTYLLTSQSCTTAIQNPVYINAVAGIIIPPIRTVVLNNNQPLPACPAILTEQDIMTMPIILNDDICPKSAPENQNGGKQNKGTKKTSIKTIFPKPKIELAPTAPKELKEYFTNYKPEESKELPTTGLKRVIYPKASRKSPNPVKKKVSKTVSNVCSRDSLPQLGEKDGEIIEINSDHKNVTPLSSDVVKTTTPKSGSHVRNLDFSVLPKFNPNRKSDPPETLKPESEQKQTVKTHFKQDEIKSWDADLRSIVQKDVQTTPKKQVANKTRKRKKITNKLNTTEQEGRLLEAAIKTPVKSGSLEESNTSVDSEKVTSGKETVPQPKTILSPSKLNASKINIVETDHEEKFITPDNVRENIALPIKANRNLNATLETPFKYQQYPKTPGIDTSVGFNDDGTPFTKMLDANLNGMDISSIETPSLLNTPAFPPNTPNIDLISPYENRPTDYSTGSSYYQPSDNEQNKILEAQLREVEKASKVIETAMVPEHLQIFNKNIIGKKNLNLIKSDLAYAEHSENSCSSSGEEKEDSSIDWCEKESNDTIIFKKKSEIPVRKYSLRTRGKKIDKVKSDLDIKNTKKDVKRPKKEINKSITKGKKMLDTANQTESGTTQEIKDIISHVKETAGEILILTPDEALNISPPDLTLNQLSVLKELEKKRLRMIDSFKAGNEPLPKPKKQVNGKFKIKPIAKVFTTKTGKKAESPRKRKRTKQLEILMNDLITSDDSEANLSPKELEEDHEKKLKQITNVVKCDKTASDVEAQNLIEGLKERGIHLMHNKSPKKKLLEIINTSDLQLESFDRESFDKQNIEGEHISIIYDETKKKTKSPPFLQDLEKTEYIGKLFLESLNREIEIHLKQTDFISLFDMKPDKKGLKNKKVETNVNNNQLYEPKKDKADFENVVVYKEQNLKKDKFQVSSKHRKHSGTGEDEEFTNIALNDKEKLGDESLSPKG